jgi:putative endonuclease
MMGKDYYVYLLTNWNNNVIYVGVTNNLERRVYEHKHKLVKGFTEKYNINKLVYFEQTNDVTSAISREKEIKKWQREKKNALVIHMNPDWNDLSLEWYKISPSGRNDRNS